MQGRALTLSYRFRSVIMGDAFEHAAGVVAVHAQESAPGDIEPVAGVRLGREAAGQVPDFRAAVGDQHRRNGADQHLQVVAAVAAEHGVAHIEPLLTHQCLDRVPLRRAGRQHVQQPDALDVINAEDQPCPHAGAFEALADEGGQGTGVQPGRQVVAEFQAVLLAVFLGAQRLQVLQQCVEVAARAPGPVLPDPAFPAFQPFPGMSRTHPVDRGAHVPDDKIRNRQVPFRDRFLHQGPVAAADVGQRDFRPPGERGGR
jgi:hypothetical protein